jgi:hemerythrin superfamily protein
MMEVHAPGDIVSLLGEDHQLIARRLSEVEDAGTSTVREAFWKLADVLVRHEVAEETVVYPLMRSWPHGDRIADERIAEQSETEQSLAGMESLDPDTAEFGAHLKALQTMVLDHARREEEAVFPLLRDHVPSEDAVLLGERYSAAKASAPNHPHPSVPDAPPGNVIIGRIAALFDRVRDAAARV